MTDGRFKRGANYTFSVLTFFFWLGILYYTYALPVSRPKFGVAFVGGSILIYGFYKFLHYYGENENVKSAAYLLIGLLGSITIFYVYRNFQELYLVRRGWSLEYEYYIAMVIVLVVIYICYIEYGAAFAGVLLFSGVYAYFGALFPGILSHGGMSMEFILQTVVLDAGNGLFGSINQLMAAWVALFLLYAGLMQAYGAFDLIQRVALFVAQFIRSGISQSAVIASIAIGSINGSQAANAAMTGSFTIPLMKKYNLSAQSSAAIESIASTGGQIMPPIMGAAAFVMASILGIAYLDVVVAGLLPAAVFFLSIAVAVHYVSIGENIQQKMPESELDDISKDELLFEGVIFAIPFIILIATLGVLQWTVGTSAMYTVLSMMVMGTILTVKRNLSESASTQVKSIILNLDQGLKQGIRVTAPIAVVVAGINAIVDILTATGVPGIISLALIDLSGGIVALAFLFAMILCIVLGLGMPTVAAYTLVAFLVAPTLISEFGIEPLAAHYFVLYSAILSGLTPPIAIAIVVASGIADSNFWRTCYQSIKIGAPLFVLPFAFISKPAIVTDPFTITGLANGAIVLIGCVLISHGLNYCIKINNIGRKFSYKVLYAVMGVLTVLLPNIYVSAGIGTAGVILIAVQFRTSIQTRITSPTQ